MAHNKIINKLHNLQMWQDIESVLLDEGPVSNGALIGVGGVGSNAMINYNNQMTMNAATSLHQHHQHHHHYGDQQPQSQAVRVTIPKMESGNHQQHHHVHPTASLTFTNAFQVGICIF